MNGSSLANLMLPGFFIACGTGLQRPDRHFTGLISLRLSRESSYTKRINRLSEPSLP
jgi:hypothetical protein